MSNDITPAKTDPAPKTAGTIAFNNDGGLAPKNLDEMWRFAQFASRSDLVPKNYKGNPENCLIAIQYGAEIGLRMMQSLQSIEVINGRPSVWGDALWALVQSCPLVENTSETYDEQTKTATCMIKRRGRPAPIVRTFSQEDARVAGLWGKAGPWTQYPRRMQQMRARGFCSRDALPEVVKGIRIYEEAIDIEPELEVLAGPRPGAESLRARAEAAAVQKVGASDALVAEAKDEAVVAEVKATEPTAEGEQK